MSEEINSPGIPASNSVPIKTTDSIGLFEKALNSWAIIDLPNLQKELDSNALEIQENQEKSLKNRKELATKTKTFKKSTDEEKLNGMNQLLKSYQNEIDTMTKKNKTVENIFFQVYRSIAEAPDPKPLFKISLDSIHTLNEVDQLKDDNKKLEEKLLSFADYSQLKKKLEQTETEMLKLNKSQVEAKEDEWKSILEEKQNNWDKRDREMNNSIDDLKNQIKELKVNEEMMKLKLKNKLKALGEDEDGEYDVAENNDKSVEEDINIKETIKYEDNDNDQIKSVNIDILNKDLQSSKTRIESLEKRNEELRREVSLANSNINIEVQKAKQSNTKRINELEGESALLVARLDHERKNIENLKTDFKTLKENSSREFKQLTVENQTLKDFKNSTSDYEEIKKELDILRQIQFGEEDVDDEENSNDKEKNRYISENENEKIQGKGVAKIESAIVQRNKKLNNDLIELRSKNEELSNKYNCLLTELEDYKNELKSTKDANSRLETDLINFENSGSNEKWETMSMISSVAPSMSGGSIRGSVGKVSPAASIAGVTESNNVTINNPQDSSILPIITQQRDRFRSRNKELEEENKKNFNKIVELKKEINGMKLDNKDLYERIRFLQFHQNNPKNNNHGGDIENKYKENYEQTLHPIEQFRIMETKRINSKISPMDRIFIQVTRSVLSTPYTRWLFVGYCLSLHLLVVMMTLFTMGSSSAVEVIDKSPLTGTTGGIANGVKGGYQ